jgi:hypothetical protein
MDMDVQREIEKETRKYDIISMLNSACGKYGDNDGWVNICKAGSYIKKKMPDFKLKNYGVSKLSKLIESHSDLYEIKKYKGKGTIMIIEYRNRNFTVRKAHDIKNNSKKYDGLEDVLPKPAYSKGGFSYHAVARWGKKI